MEVSVVYVCKNTKNSSYTASDYCNGSSSQSVSYASEKSIMFEVDVVTASQDKSSGYRCKRSST